MIFVYLFHFEFYARGKQTKFMQHNYTDDLKSQRGETIDNVGATF